MKEIEIPEDYEVRIEGNKIIFVPKESKDERIRNDIMKAVENQFPYERVEEIRAYLEKQKEQKRVPTDEQLMATDFWKTYLKESLIPGAKPNKEDIEYLLPIARKYFWLIIKDL